MVLSLAYWMRLALRLVAFALAFIGFFGYLLLLPAFFNPDISWLQWSLGMAVVLACAGLSLKLIDLTATLTPTDHRPS